MVLDTAGAVISKERLYEEGSVFNTTKQDYIETGEYTESVAAAFGSIPSMYDYDPTSGYTFTYGTASDHWVQWKFQEKAYFKNIQCYISGNDGAYSGSNTIRLQTSDDGSTWTDQDTVTISGAATKYANLIASGLRTKYIRVYQDYNSGDGGWVKVITMKSVVK